jgi:hypothetical protein
MGTYYVSIEMGMEEPTGQSRDISFGDNLYNNRSVGNNRFTDVIFAYYRHLYRISHSGGGSE